MTRAEFAWEECKVWAEWLVRVRGRVWLPLDHGGARRG